jgi:hypothetical protein
VMNVWATPLICMLRFPFVACNPDLRRKAAARGTLVPTACTPAEPPS